MKKLFLLTLTFFCQHIMAQTIHDDISTKTLIFEHFKEGQIYFKNGSSTFANVNFDAEKQRIIFIQGEQYQELTGLESIDSISIVSKIFVPFKNKIIEKTKNKSLYLTYSLQSNPLETTTDHNGSRKEDQSVVSNTVSTVYTTGRFEKTWKYKFLPIFWILKNNELVNVGSPKELAKAFKIDREYIHAFITSNQLDVHKEDDALVIMNMLQERSK